LGEKSEQEHVFPRFRFPETDLILQIGSLDKEEVKEEEDKENEQSQSSQD
jgi:hypothetical protein